MSWFDLQAGQAVDMSKLMTSFTQHNMQPYPQMLDAVRSLKAEGMKTALLTNNWFNSGNQDSYIPVDLSLFDVVCIFFVFVFVCRVYFFDIWLFWLDF